MNERIKELSEQAEKYADENFRGEPTWSEAYDSKFAELIIRRVIDRIEDWAEDDFGLNALAIEILNEFDMELKDEQ